MARAKTVYECENCGAQAPKWSGQCADCGAWNTLVESRPVASGPGRVAPGGRARAQYAGASGVFDLSDVKGREAARVSTGLSELDRVLGGGLVAGSAVLIGGDPGIGKSTLLLQACARLANDRGVLYVTGEESLEQVRLRAERLAVGDASLRLAAETCVERILATAEAEKPAVLIVDSIQTIFSEAVQSAPGAVGQLRESAAQLVRFAKQTGTAVFLVGHVTKEGVIAGPRVLEHMVDTVLYFENDAGSRYRVIRAVKNRFGAVNELGVFAMDDAGLKEVRNPSAIFLSGHETGVSGSAVMVAREGSRPLLVEVQALVDASHMNNPRRVAVGLDQNRLSMLLAVMHRHGGIAMADQDVFINVVGGLKVEETAADLPLLMAALSSFRDRPLPAEMVVFGEIGLSGEVRPVYNGEERLNEAAKHGFRRAIVPKANAPRRAPAGMEVVPVRRLSDAINAVLRD
ncbi:DNA repair protein RadA [Natronospira bacteriovora]|uniref:DNA repair protein RadA n=1 Tax=Natronospira bacteriovora TaxID=3069753 RepID=A0ABU0W4G9_9GAMM|nr:DNA repair protein RadA [Natronospira sp. AB-CW4]MDQ2068849.1 DNA repair protein RadA [Natronospira sp. AB-CW4]